MEVYANVCMDSQVCKLSALTDRAVTWDMFGIPSEKLNKTTSNY